MNVLVLTRYERLGASSRVRFLQFLPGLASDALQFDLEPLLDNAYVEALYGGQPVRPGHIAGRYIRRLRTLARLREYDLVWLEKEALPWIPAAVELKLLARLPYVVDLDDAWFHRYDQHSLAIVRALLGTKIDKVMRAAAAVVVGNDYLADHARRIGADNVHLIPNAIDMARYPPSPPATAQHHSQGKPLVLGWIGTPLNAPNLQLLKPAFERLLPENIKLHVVGARVPGDLAEATECFEWTEATEIAHIAAFDVGVMPLYDTPFERGKSAYRLLQVMAAGKPVIASPVGFNTTVVRHGINGFLAASPDDWVQAVSLLRHDESLRSRMGLEARRTVEEHHSLARALPDLAAVLLQAGRAS
jgi:glycosyltransferase involved in cell wall biosynthesis